MEVRLRVLTRLTGPEARLCEKSVPFFVCNCGRCNSSCPLSRSQNWRSDDDDDGDGRKFFCRSRTRTIRWCFSWELRRLAWGSEICERVPLCVLSFFGFSFMVLKDMMRSSKVLRRQLLVDDTKMCSPMSGIETSFSSLFCLQICAMCNCMFCFPSLISTREVKSNNESFVFLRMNICKCSMWKDFLFCVSQEFFSKSKTIHSTTFTRADFWRDVQLKSSFRTWFLRVFFCRSWDLFQSSHLQM